jgi:kynurenine formamidase
MVLLALPTAACTAPREEAKQPVAAAGAAAYPIEFAALLSGATLVDLTHTFDATTLVWPTSRPFELQKVADGVTPGGFYYASNDVHTAEHGGTHVDAPIHFAAGQLSADRIPLSRLIGPAVVIDVTSATEKSADYLISVGDVTQWETTHGPIEKGSLVLLRTGFGSRWPDAERYLGTALRGPEGVARLHFPGLHPDAAAWLVRARAIGAVGIDTASIDRGQSTTYETHRILAAAGVPAFENLANLEQLPTRGAVLVALPMKIGGGSGGPLRAVALVPTRR